MPFYRTPCKFPKIPFNLRFLEVSERLIKAEFHDVFGKIYVLKKHTKTRETL